MIGKISVVTTLSLVSGFTVVAQQTPIYQVTVIERTVKAVDYQYRNGPTKVDFRGTVLLPHAKGEAVVESKAGRTEINAKFERVQAASRYGPEYLTYVLWAITPEGHAKNLGEVLADGSDHAHLNVTTDLQAFGMIITAEPYAAVRQPSDVVVMENEVRPDTIGHIEPVRAKAELLPRGHYTYTVPAEMKAPANGEKLSMDRYESLLEVYEAQNAVQIAKSAGADKYAAETYTRAEQLLRQAQEFQAKRADRGTTVTAARKAAQTAEDARAIALQHKHDDEVAQAKAEANREQQLRIQAEQAAAADRAQLEAERAARQRTEVDAAVPRGQQPATVAPVSPPPPADIPPPPPADPPKTELRVQLLQDLLAAMPSRDTPRGLVVTLGNGDFRGTSLSPEYFARLSRVAAIVAAHPGLYVAVEGSSDNAHDAQEAAERAAAVRNELMRSGVPAATVSARGLGSSRPLAPAGHPENRRVEITISGEPIGTAAYWDKTYTVAPRQ
jgi:outer membrane protein OmpA-like peptidoglycan-associated protein